MRISKALKVIIILIIVVVALVLVLPVAFSDYVAGTPLPPLQLPERSVTSADTAPLSLDGTWTTGAGSVAGFRVGESFLLQSGTIVGRTDAVTGSLVISNNVITSGTFQVDLSKVTITINQQTNNLAKVLDTVTYPVATFTLTEPITVAQLPANGQTLSSNATGSLTMNNITRSVTLTLTGRYDGEALEATGSAPVLVSDWGIESPIGIHNDAEIEFLTVLHRE